MPTAYATESAAPVTVEDLAQQLAHSAADRGGWAWSGWTARLGGSLRLPREPQGDRWVQWEEDLDDEDRAMLAEPETREHIRTVEAAFAAADRGEDVDWERVIDEHIIDSPSERPHERRRHRSRAYLRHMAWLAQQARYAPGLQRVHEITAKLSKSPYQLLMEDRAKERQ